MFNDSKKKVMISIGVGLIVLVVITLFVILLNRKKESIVENGGIDINNGVGSVSGNNIEGGYNGSWGSIGSPKGDKAKIDIVIPSQKIEGSVDKLELNGSYGKLDIVKGDKKSSVEVKIGGIIFDTTLNKAISPSDIKKGSKLSVYTYSDLSTSKLDMDLAEVVIVSPEDNMGYVPIGSLKEDTKKVEFTTNEKEYIVGGNLYSALSGKAYTEIQIDELEEGDRVIYYGVEKDNKVIIEKGYVYPAFK